MEVLHLRCAGLDVHKKTVVASVRLAEENRVTTEVKTFATTTAGLLALSDWLSANDCTHVAMEATGVYWRPVWHVLSDGEFQLILANAAHVKNVPGRKTDVSDAAWLAELLAHGLIRASFVPDAVRRRNCATFCARASSWCAKGAVIHNAFTRCWRTPTSRSMRNSPTCSERAAGRSSTPWWPARQMRSGLPPWRIAT